MPEIEITCTCQKCGKTMNEKQFYTYKDGRKTELCKKCLTMHVDPFNAETFTWLLEKMDVPYIPQEWNALRDKDFAKDPNKVSGMAIFGKYLSKMKLKQWNHYSWKDNEMIQEKNEYKVKQSVEAQRKFQQEIQEQYEKGEISESQYKTLMDTETQNVAFSTAIPRQYIGNNNPYNENNFMSEDELIDPAADLTDEDKLYLAMKWGRLYKPNEWVELEKKYDEMMNSFDIHDSDTIGTLILICKTYLKMNNAIDVGDMDGYQKLARTYDTLRKSANFTAAQNKKSEGKFVDSVGQLVAYCEKEGGKIPKFKIEADLDIVDKVIRDLKEYNRTLIYEDAALARQIEEYLKKREIAEELKRERKQAKQNNENYEMDDEEIHKYNEMLEEQKQSDFKVMYGEEDDIEE